MKRTCAPVDERFWSHVIKTDGCWLWTNYTDKDGYGYFRLRRGVSVGAHRFAWSLANGCDIPKGLLILHKCDNPTCVNPKHLYVGTSQQNEQDKASRGRYKNWRTPVPKHGLNADAVRAIRADPRSSYKIAGEYGVCPSTIQHVRRGATWSNIE